MNITFRDIVDNDLEYNMIYEWCKNDFVYQWFEQRILSFDEIKKKYKNKIEKKKQKIFIIQCNNKDIGLVQVYKYDDDLKINYLSKFKNIYEYDIFIGDKNYISKGLGSKIINLVNNTVYKNFNGDAIILRPFKRNIRAVKCYEKCGFKVIFEYEDSDTIGNNETFLVLINTYNDV